MADEVHLELIEQGVEDWNRWREENPDSLPDLSGAYLFEAELGGINLSGANLSRACLIGANLKEANLAEANLQNLYASAVALERANLSGANLRQANLSEARLAQANLSQANAQGTNFSMAELTGACVEKWQVSAKTDFSDTKCDYLYQKQPQQGRYPEDSSFGPETLAQFMHQYFSAEDPGADSESSALGTEGSSSVIQRSMAVHQETDIRNPNPTVAAPSRYPASASTRNSSSTTRNSSSTTVRSLDSRQSRFSLQQWRLIAAGSLIGLVLAMTAFVSVLSQIITARRSANDPPEYLLGPDVNLASLPCNELPPPDLEAQEPSFIYSNGVVFYGQFQDGIPVNDRGTMVFDNGDRYDGEFRNGERNGCGTFTFASGRQYMGQFQADQFHGVGIWKLETGERYVGQFEFNRCEGWGTFLFTDGSSKSGTWENGNLVGDNLSCNRGVPSEPEDTVP